MFTDTIQHTPVVLPSSHDNKKTLSTTTNDERTTTTHSLGVPGS